MICGVDFGTSNSSCNLYDPRTRVLQRTVLDPANERDPKLLRSYLYFAPDSHEPICGANALQACAAHEGEGRFIASIKTHLASRDLHSTDIHGRAVTLSELVACLLRRIRAAIPDGVRIERLNVGRPVRFSEDEAEDRLAEKRLAEAYRLAGFPEPSFVPEPVAAAHSLGDEVPRGVRVLVCDFGGGTLDYSLVVFEKREGLRCRVLATHGIWLGGDLLDGTLLFRLFREYFGAGVRFWNWDKSKLLPLPASLFTKLMHWRNLWQLRPLAEHLQETVRWGVTEPEPIERLLALVEDLTAPVELFGAVERAKVALSSQERATIAFHKSPIHIDRELGVRQFEELVAQEVRRFSEALEEVLRRAGVRGRDVELALCTGGSSQIPCFRRELALRLPEAEVLCPDYFTSVSQGLARVAA
jgi:hypothetical chaperone protein